MKRVVPFILAVGVVYALGVTGCGGEPSPVVSTQPLATAIRTQEVAPAAPVEGWTGSSWRYDPIGKRDPYRPYDVALPPNPLFPLTDLQRWELDQLRLVGIVRQNGHRLAMLEDPEGRGHIVHAGDYVGTRWGQVTSIGPGQLVITEYVKDDYGRTLPLTLEMPLADPWGNG